jgi:chemotaxis protein MotB
MRAQRAQSWSKTKREGTTMSRLPVFANARAAAMAVLPAAVLLSGCVAQSDYDALQAQNQQLQTENQRLEAQISALRAQATFVEAGDLLFPPGGYELSAAGKTELASNIAPKLRGLQNVKIVVFGFTDNAPVGPELQRAGINDNLTLSSRRAGSIVTFLISQGVNPKIISAKGFGDTRPVAPNDTPANRAKNRRIVITVQGPGAPSA